MDCVSFSLLSEWTPPPAPLAGTPPISMACADAASRLLLVSTTSRQILLLAVDPAEAGEEPGGRILVRATATMPHEVACIALCSSSIPTTSAAPFATLVHDAPLTLAAAGLWIDLSVRLLEVPSLLEVSHALLGGAVIPRSLAFLAFDTSSDTPHSYLLAALGDGHLVYFALTDGHDASAGARSSDADSPIGRVLGTRKAVTIGAKPISLTPFRAHGVLQVFACCDHPTLIHQANGKLLFSTVNLKDTTHMAPFGAADLHDHLAISTEVGYFS